MWLLLTTTIFFIYLWPTLPASLPCNFTFCRSFNGATSLANSLCPKEEDHRDYFANPEPFSTKDQALESVRDGSSSLKHPQAPMREHRLPLCEQQTAGPTLHSLGTASFARQQMSCLSYLSCLS